jgi:hypothetical protein
MRGAVTWRSGSLAFEPSSSDRTTTPATASKRPSVPRRSHALEALHDVEVVVTDFATRDGKEPQNRTWNALAQGLHDHGYGEGE